MGFYFTVLVVIIWKSFALFLIAAFSDVFFYFTLVACVEDNPSRVLSTHTICWILKGCCGFCQMKPFWFWGWWNTVLLLICAWHTLSLCWQSVAIFIQEFVKCHLDHVCKINCVKSRIQAKSICEIGRDYLLSFCVLL